MDHRKKEADGEGVPEYHLDYCFFEDEKVNKLTTLAAVESHSKMKKATEVPSKALRPPSSRSMPGLATKKSIALGRPAESAQPASP